MKLGAGDKIKSTSSAMVLEDLIGKLVFDKAAEGKSDNKDGK